MSHDQSKQTIHQHLHIDPNAPLFAEYSPNDEINERDCLDRIKFILKLYQNWINVKTKNEEKIMDIYDVINSELSSNYDISGFLKDYRYIVSQNRDIVAKYDGDQSLECDIESCYVQTRINRDKGQFAANNNKRRQLFFDTNEDSSIQQSIFIQDILDGLHEWIYHTIHVKLEEFIENDESDDEDDDTMISLKDTAMKAFNEYIEKKASSSSRYRSNRSINSRYNNQNVTNSKFMTTTYNDVIEQQQMSHGQINTPQTIDTEDALAIYQSQVYGNDQLIKRKVDKAAHFVEERKGDDYEDLDLSNSYSLCFIDHINKEIEAYNKLNAKIIAKFKDFLSEQSYDSDAIEFDIKDVKKYMNSSNILDAVNNNAILSEILIRFCDKRASQGSIYDSGIRFFYWPYYKEIEDEHNLLFVDDNGIYTMESNTGYSIKHWYIPKKYQDLKHELFYNKIYQFTPNQFADILNASTIKLESWLKDSNCRKLESWAPQWVKCYGMQQNEQISVQHIMSLLFYTNFSKQSAAFSGTFRRQSPFESDESFKARNREFWNWSKLLRETVECFGQQMSTGLYTEGVKALYHGVSNALVFDSTLIKLCGPLSTTVGMYEFCVIHCSNTAFNKFYPEFEVAHNIFGSTGIVLSIQVGYFSDLYWDCNYWSCYQNENERLFLGGQSVLTFITIRNIPLCINYAPYIKILNMFDDMTKGFASIAIIPKVKDVRGLSRMINCAIKDNDGTNNDLSIPTYILSFFRHYLLQREFVLLNIRYFAIHDDGYYEHYKAHGYGHVKFVSAFFPSIRNESNNGSDQLDLSDAVPKFSIFLQLVLNLKRIIIINGGNLKPLKPSILLSDALFMELIDSLILLNSMSYSSFESIYIVEPLTSIQSFI